MAASPLTVFLDFDGTITTRDVTDAILEAFADPDWERVEDAWKAGRIGSRECLAAQMALVSATERQMQELLDGIDVDPGLRTLLARCARAEVPVQVVSDGFDYCISRILRRPALKLRPYLDGLRIASSHLKPDGGRWRASFDSFEGTCSHGCATCKPAVMDRLNADRALAIFAGDGLSDRYAVQKADRVFAKGALAEYCDKQSIAYIRYETLGTIASALEGLRAEASWPRTVRARAFPGKAFSET